MSNKKNLMDAMDNYGRMLQRNNYPGNIFLFRG